MPLLRIFLVLLLFTLLSPSAMAQDKMRKLNKNEKSALKDFKKGGSSGSGTAKKGKEGGGKTLFFFNKKKKIGFDRAYSQQSKDVKKRMRKHKRKFNKW